jgi:CBS domain containing-hemolysin-like protein
VDTIVILVAIVGLIAANGFFVAAEFALVAVDRSDLARRAESGDVRARRAQELVRKLSFHLSGAQFGITVTSLALGIVSAPFVAGLLGPVLEPVFGGVASGGAAILVALVLATAVQMVVGELMPKTLAISRPTATARRLGGAVAAYGLVFGPIIRLLDAAANRTVRMMGVEPVEELSQVRTLTEFEVLFRSAAEGGVLGPTAAELLARSVGLGRRTAADVLVPRQRVAALPMEATVADLVVASRRTGHSRFVVFGVDLDDLRGVVHVRVAYGLARDQRSATPVAEVMGDLLAVPESRDLDDLLGDMRATGNHLVAVVDEHGGTAGIVTMEDVLERLVGDITDEHDRRPPSLTRPARPGEWTLDGTIHLDELADQTGLELPDGPYETLAGWFMASCGRVPQVGDRLVVGDVTGGWEVEVSVMDRRRLATARVIKTDGST